MGAMEGSVKRATAVTEAPAARVEAPGMVIKGAPPKLPVASVSAAPGLSAKSTT